MNILTKPTRPNSYFGWHLLVPNPTFGPYSNLYQGNIFIFLDLSFLRNNLISFWLLGGATATSMVSKTEFLITFYFCKISIANFTSWFAWMCGNVCIRYRIPFANTEWWILLLILGRQPNSSGSMDLQSAQSSTFLSLIWIGFFHLIFISKTKTNWT